MEDPTGVQDLSSDRSSLHCYALAGLLSDECDMNEYSSENIQIFVKLQFNLSKAWTVSKQWLNGWGGPWKVLKKLNAPTQDLSLFYRALIKQIQKICCFPTVRDVPG